MGPYIFKKFQIETVSLIPSKVDVTKGAKGDKNLINLAFSSKVTIHLSKILIAKKIDK
jgi:hypothetical protein